MTNSKKTILHLCADIGSDSQIFFDNGFNVIKVGIDVGVENFTPPSNVYGVIANPVCTEFSCAKGFDKKGDTTLGMFLVDHCIRIIKQCNPKFWCIENPASGRLKDFLGTPDFTYQPWQFGDPWTKKTALWGNFNKPTPLFSKWEDVEKNELLYTRPGRPKPGFAFLHKSAIDSIQNLRRFKPLVNDDMSFRSLCPQGFAQSFFDANSNL